jgi:hypothetical protein
MELRFPWETDPPVAARELPAEADPPRKPRGRRPASAQQPGPLTSPAWLYHHLTISGPVDGLTEFAAAARGSGIVPWQIDLAALEEDIFVRAVSQPAATRNLSVAGCRILARQFRERVAAHQAKAAALVGQSQACPFDLHTLLPVPAAILQLGPTHPTSLAWLSEHWGTTDRLRQVVERSQPTTGRRLPAGQAVIGYGFFTGGGVAQGSTGVGPWNGNGGDTPHAAIARLGDIWPTLCFTLQPHPAD